MPVQAAPIVVNPSGDFLGDDGAWSTFQINTGTPPQEVHVLVSTQTSATWVISGDGCQSSDASNCSDLRGQLFDSTKSSSWTPKAPYQLGASVNLGYDGNDINGTYGFDTIGIPGQSGVANVSVTKQVVAGIVTNKFYLGNLGLNAAPINFSVSSASGTDTSPSLLTSLKSQELIPSLTYGYTAGASYKQAGGSLVLGGYDLSRFTPNNVSFSFAPTQTRQLEVSLMSITYSDPFTQAPLLSSSILALVDSTVPYLWLPQSTCLAFEKAFGISWDPIHNLYLVNDTVHDAVLKRNPVVSFELSNSMTGGPTVKISFPYASFDLNASYPLVKQQSRYFPLQRAPDENSYTLGRTFFQEAFLVVDYDHSNFSVSQSLYDPNSPSHIIAIASPSGTSTQGSNPISTNTLTKASSRKSFGAGAIAGIVIAFLVLALLVAGAFLFIRHGRRKSTSNQRDHPSSSAEKPPVMTGNSKRPSLSREDSSSIRYKPIPDVTVAQVHMSPPLSEASGDDFFGQGSSSKPTELPVNASPRSELPSPAPVITPELPGSELQMLRSELSTPEPVFPNSELPTPEISHEMPSPSMNSSQQVPGKRSSDALPSPRSLVRSIDVNLVPDMDDPDSILSSPPLDPSYQGQRSLRLGSISSSSSSEKEPSGSEALFSHSTIRAFPRVPNRRVDSGSSDIATPNQAESLQKNPADSHTNQMSPISPISPRPIIQRTVTQVRPPQARMSSTGSDTWETRLEMSPGIESENGRSQNYSSPIIHENTYKGKRRSS